MADNWIRKRIRRSNAHQALAEKSRVKNWVLAERQGKAITLADGAQLTEFLSCSYLGLELHPNLVYAAQESLSRWGTQFSSSRGRARIEEFDELDALLGRIFLGASCVTFPTVTLVHLGVLPLLASGELPGFPMGDSPEFLLDYGAHSSMKILQGILEQFGDIVPINVADDASLRCAMTTSRARGRTPVVICDGVGSMSGLSPVKRIVSLCEELGGYLYIDDAHGISVIGERGCGHALTELGGAMHERMILVSSLSKAFGAYGGFVGVPSVEASVFIKRHSATYTFSGPPPLCLTAAAVASAKLHLTPELGEMQRRFWSNVALFDELAQGAVVNRGLRSPVRGLLVGDENTAIGMGDFLRRSGIAVNVALYPVVEHGKALIRLSLSSLHTEEQIRRICSLLNAQGHLETERTGTAHENP